MGELVKREEVDRLINQYTGEIMRALPRHMDAEHMKRAAMTLWRTNAKLQECTPRSLIASVMIAAQMGLVPGLLGHGHLVPYMNRKANVMECQFIPGWQGLVELVRRSGAVSRLEAHVVHQNDKFTYKTGLTTVLEHEPNIDGDPGAPRLAYAVAEFANGGHHVEVMTRAQIEAIRDASQGYRMSQRYGAPSPWIDHADEMWRKTVIRRLCKYLPKSVEMARALAVEDRAAAGAAMPTLDEAINVDWEVASPEPTTDPDPAAERPASRAERVRARVVRTPEQDQGPDMIAGDGEVEQ